MKKLLLFLLLTAAVLQGWAIDLYIVGDATLLSGAGNSYGTIGWAYGSGNRTLTHMDDKGSNEFKWTGLLKRGLFKICTAEDTWNGYHPQTADQEIYADGNPQTMTTNDGDDYKWKIVFPGIYNVTVNTSTSTITITPYWFDISTADDLITFANTVNDATESNPEGARWARLTADIDMNGKTFPGIGRDDKWTRYHGTFDGQGHKISNLNMTSKECGFITVAGGGCTVKNLLIDKTCSFNGTSRIAALMNCCNYIDFGTTVDILNCGNEANVTGTAEFCGGLLGGNYHNSIRVTIKNSFNAGTIGSSGGGSAPIAGKLGSNMRIENTYNIGIIDNSNSNGSFARWDSGSLENCFTTTTWGECEGLTLNYEMNKVKSGELCYSLNGDQGGTTWTQTIDTDDFPIPFSTHKKVYQYGTTYLNDGDNVTIGSATDLDNFSTIVNAGATSVNATVSTSFSATAALNPIGTSDNMYKGTFDGGGYSITLSINNTNASVNNRALIGYATDGATIQNLILKGSVTSSGNVTAGFIAEAKGGGTVTITNCGNEAAITGGGGETAAIIANNNGNSKCTLLLTNVYNKAGVEGTGDVASICAYQGNSSSTFTNVYNSGNVTGDARGKFVRQWDDDGIYTNCYSTTLTSYDHSSVSEITNTDLTSGKLCYKLNNETGVWKQKIGGTRGYPNFEDTETVNQVVADESYTNLTNISDGKVQISSAANLEQFAKEVYYGNTAMNAELSADINSYSGWFIGSADNYYTGTFDGKKHKITVNYDKSSEDKIGLFQHVKGGTIQNLIVDGTIQGRQFMAGLVNVSKGRTTIKNVVVDVNMTSSYGGDGTHGGVISVANDNPIVENVAFVGSITASSSYGSCGLIGYADNGDRVNYKNCYVSGTLTLTGDNNRVFGRNGEYCENCYTTLDMTTINDSGRFNGGKVESADVASGKLCYLLNGDQKEIVWYQNLSGTVDSYPLPFSTHSQVYSRPATGDLKCDGTSTNGSALSYSNTETIEVPDHSYSNGWCTVCNAYQENAITPTDDWYEISLPWQLRWMVESVNQHNLTYRSAQIKLTSDIDYSAYTTQDDMFGKPQNTFKGTFDGQCHTVNVAFNNSSADETGLFRRINGATIKNLKVDGTITTTKKFAGGICAGIYTSGTITNCESHVTINDNRADDANNSTNDATHGGIVACLNNIDKSDINVTNCLFSGAFNASNCVGCAGIVGWTTNEESKKSYVKINHNLVTGNLDFKDVSTNGIYVRSKTGELNDNNFTSDISSFNVITGHDLSRKTEDLESGELCYALNGAEPQTIKWYQDLTIDDYPVPFDTHSIVYRRGASAPFIYSNITTGSTAKIKSAKDLMDFSALVNDNHADLDAELANDIDMSGKTYTPIGTSSYKYKGTFDGNYYRIKELNINNNTAYQGLFSYCAGATIRNLILDSTCSIKTSDTNNGCAAFVAVGSTDNNADETLTIENCGNEASVEGGGNNSAAFFGFNKSSGHHLTIVIRNCYNKGNVGNSGSGGGHNCAFIGWNDGNKYTIENCYNIGTITKIEGSNSWARGGDNQSSSSNCYTTVACADVEGLEASYSIDKVHSGELCYNLQGEEDTNVFTQDLSQESYPIFGSKAVTAGQWFSNSNDVYYNLEDGNYTVYQLNMSDTQTEYNVPDDGTVTAKNVKMTRTLHQYTGEEPYVSRWNTFCSPVALAKSNFTAIKKLTGVTKTGDNYTMTFGDEDVEGDYIVAGRPYMVQVDETKSGLTATNVAVAAAGSSTSSDTFNGLTFNGNFTSQNAPTGSFIISNNVFYNVDSTVALKAFRGYITVAGAGVKALNFDFEDMGDGINSLTPALSEGEGAIYNVAGQRIQKMQKGINIVNGKKIMK